MGKYHLSASRRGPAGKNVDVKNAKVSYCVPQCCKKAVSFLFRIGFLYIKKQSGLGNSA